VADADADEVHMIRAVGLVKDVTAPRGRLGRRGRPVRTVDGLSLQVRSGEVLGLVGPAGAGKTTAALMLAGRLVPDAGRVSYDGTDLHRVGRRERTRVRDELQVVLGRSDEMPGRRSVREVLTSALDTGAARGADPDRPDPADLLAEVGLGASVADVAVGKLTGDQRALVGLARAVALRPALVVCQVPDDAMSAAERSLVADRLLRLRDEAGTALVILARTLADLPASTDRVVVMYLGCVMEILDRHDLPSAALHPFTSALILAESAGSDDAGPFLKGEPLGPGIRPSGCVFRTLCFRAQGRCADEVPQLTRPLGSTHPVACHFPERLTQGAWRPGGADPDPDAAADGRSMEPTAREFAEG
jgi:oligopeptide/dipeptide ABC transporter ATP-binding protein